VDDIDAILTGKPPARAPAGDDIDTILNAAPPRERPPAAPAIPDPSIWDSVKAGVGDYAARAADSFKNLGHTVGSAVTGAADLVSPVTSKGELHAPFSQLMDPAYRHEAERGLSDTVTGGLAERAANAADTGFASAAPAEAAAQPGARALGQVAGSALPSPFNALGGAAAEAIPGTGAVAGAGRAVAGYEAAAVPAAALAAPEGKRLDAAFNAATDPAAVATSVASGAGPTAKELLAKRARSRMVDQAIKDIAGSKETGMSKPTDRRLIARQTETLRDEFRDPDAIKIADTARRDPAAAWDLVQKRVDKITQDRAASYAAVDSATGGIHIKELRRFLEEKATELGRDPGQLQEQRALAATIKNLDDTWGSQLNPMVPTIKFRQYVTRLQTSAADVMGGLEETQRYKINNMVAGVAKEFLDRNLDVATKLDPQMRPVVDGLKETNRRTAAWLSMEDALKTRADKLQTQRMSDGGKSKMLTAGVAGAAAAGHFLHSPGAAVAAGALGVAPYVAPVVDRAVTRGVAGMTGTPVNPAAMARLIQLARAGDANAQAQLAQQGR
jgi:hypothetical protein